jgi:hypothetical protein
MVNCSETIQPKEEGEEHLEQNLDAFHTCIDGLSV